jgi:hypothetical protein
MAMFTPAQKPRGLARRIFMAMAASARANRRREVPVVYNHRVRDRIVVEAAGTGQPDA